MKIHKLSCPNCGAALDLNVEEREYVFCAYCGQKFFVDNEKKEYTFNQNVNVTHINRIIDEAKIAKIKSEAKEQQNAWYGLIGAAIFWIILVIMINISSAKDDREKEKAIAQGKISAGYYMDYEGEDYEAVVKKFKALGFENIEVIDLKDSGIALWKNKKVESVSINGDSSFGNSDYFEPNAKVVISYH